MATICQTCGSADWPVALIYCDECQEFAVHRYCLDVFPKTFEEYVVWLCDDCKPEAPDIVQPTAQVSDAEVAKEGSDLPEQSNSDPESVELLRSENKLMKKRKKNEELVKDEECGIQILPAPAKTMSSESESSNQFPEASCTCHSCKSQDGIEATSRSTVDNAKISVSDSEMDSKFSPLPELDSSKSASNVNYVPAQPNAEPIWRGGLSTTGAKRGYSCRIVVHLCQLACSRVSQEAKLFPDMLSSALNPRAELWPKGFEQHGPMDDNIAVYFFPESERDEEVFKNLISEMIRKDLALRAVVTHAELIVFTSTKLPMRLWRYQGRLYLWGVLKEKQASAQGNILHRKADKGQAKTASLKNQSRPLVVS